MWTSPQNTLFPHSPPTYTYTHIPTHAILHTVHLSFFLTYIPAVNDLHSSNARVVSPAHLTNTHNFIHTCKCISHIYIYNMYSRVYLFIFVQIHTFLGTAHGRLRKKVTETRCLQLSVTLSHCLTDSHRHKSTPASKLQLPNIHHLYTHMKVPSVHLGSHSPAHSMG